MNMILGNTLNRSIMIAILLSSIVLLFSCSKNDQQNVVNNDNAVMKVFVAGVFGNETLVSQTGNSKIGRANLSSTDGITKASDGETIKLPEFDALISLKQDGYGVSPISQSSGTPSISKGIRANVPMGNGMKYRLLLYLENGQFSKSVELTAGTPANIPVRAGEKYSWIAYSYNTTEPIAEIVNATNPSIPTFVTKELLHATGQITISSTVGANDYLPITFKRRLGRVAVEINATGMFARDVMQAVVSFEQNYFKEGTFNLKTGTTSNLTSPVVTTTLDGTAPEKNVRTLYYYTADTAALIADLKVRLHSVKIKNDVGTETNYTPNTVFSYTNNNTGFTPVAGTSHTAIINIVPSGSPVGPTIWAPGNLYYDAVAPDGYKYKFRSEPSNIFNTTTDAAEMNKEYWQWMPDALVPYVANYVHSVTGPHQDPCRLVYPLGRWRMPTRQDYLDLIANSTKTVGENTTAKNRYVTFTIAGGSVTFPSLGYRVQGNGAIDDYRWTGTDHRAIGYYWTSTPQSSNDGYYLFINQYYSNSTTYALDVQENLDVENGANIRCVKN
ncbi:fimbrillin family protein [Sphingobacterium sp. SRCM116780]|uniref:fimbrillin family protein n=1 Tax=Sphingobacterium sp. SRCM116780 TaxID=2907623 RepID=UPI001F452002|nr:fimbrillin family protein [Sphingobacterium sp. SRCM116780]UIR57439.1 fimbrillin family protein [Sphingobacterium sp. SRCM116780]